MGSSPLALGFVLTPHLTTQPCKQATGACVPCRAPTAAEVLRSHALSKGWVVGSGLPDETRSGRQILKDFVAGKLLHCCRPPGCSTGYADLGLPGQVAPEQVGLFKLQLGVCPCTYHYEHHQNAFLVFGMSICCSFLRVHPAAAQTAELVLLERQRRCLMSGL